MGGDVFIAEIGGTTEGARTQAARIRGVPGVEERTRAKRMMDGPEKEITTLERALRRTGVARNEAAGPRTPRFKETRAPLDAGVGGGAEEPVARVLAPRTPALGGDAASGELQALVPGGLLDGLVEAPTVWLAPIRMIDLTARLTTFRGPFHQHQG